MLLWLLLVSQCAARSRFQHRDAALSTGFANFSTVLNSSVYGLGDQFATSQSILTASSISATTKQEVSTGYSSSKNETNLIASPHSTSLASARLPILQKVSATTNASATGNVLSTVTNAPNLSIIRPENTKLNGTFTPLSGFNISTSSWLLTGENSHWSPSAPFTHPNASIFNETITSVPDDSSPTDEISSTSACPTTYASDYEPTKRGHEACEWLGRRFDWDNRYGTYYGGDCLGAYCSASFWETAVPNYTGDEYSTLITTLTWFDQHVGSLESATRTWSYYFTSILPWSPPCCAVCEISAPEVEFIFWPNQVGGQPSNASSFSSYVDETGFTFVYVAFTSLAASDRCGTVGEVIPLTTLAFDLSEISTLMVTETLCPRSDIYSFLGWPPDLFPDVHPETNSFDAWITRPMVIADVAQNCSTIPGYTYNTYNINDPSSPIIDVNGIGDPCHPWLDLPDRIKMLQARWSNCQLSLYTGLVDPPRTLHPVNILVPTSTSAISTPGIPTVIATPDPSIPDGPRQTSVPTTSNLPSKGVDPPPGPQQSGNSAGTPPRKTSTLIPVVTVAIPPSRPPPRTSSSSSSVIVLPNPTDPVTIILPPQVTKTGGQPAQVITIVPIPVDTKKSSNTMLPNAPPLVVISGTKTQILAPGSAITIGGTTSTDLESHVTLVGGTQLVLDPPRSTQDEIRTIQVVPVESSGPQVLILLGSETITATGSIGSSLVIDGQTLLPGSSVTVGGSRWIEGGKITTLGGTEISLDPEATMFVVEHSSSIPLSAALFMPESSEPSILTLDSSTFMEDPLGRFFIEGQTLVPGNTINYHGTILSMDPQGTAVVFGGSSTMFLQSPHVITSVTVDGNTYTFAAGSSIVIDGTTTTLANGQVTVTGGQTLFLDPAGNFVIVTGTMTSIVATASSTANPGSLPSGGFVVMTSGQIDAATVPSGLQPSGSDPAKENNGFREEAMFWNLFSGILLCYLGMHAT